MPPKKGKLVKQKQYLNNVDIPLSKTGAKVLKVTNENVHPQPPTVVKSILKPTPVPQELSSATGTRTDTKYKQPELHSTLAVRKQIEMVKQQAHKAQQHAITSIGELTPRSQKIIKSQISKKLNYQFDHAAFKELESVNVNDSVLQPAPRSAAKARFKFQGKKDPEPSLSDYLNPIPPLYETQPYVPPQIAPRNPAISGWNNFDNIMRVFKRINPID
ncbi:uncharacterized protein LOC131211541 [Anopheles bellator]|uniref:uncharacterized protein LOC131211541 n=1 Tax=Anopheles bellator TaxID=139047 RepID=UPI0026479FC3|nr:uncharacterized protein LOC131211541 [Anopheles bellator]